MADAATGARSLGASIAHHLDFRGAALSNPGGSAFTASGWQVGGYASFAAGCSAHEAVRLSRAKVRAEIGFSGSRFINPGDDAIRCRNADARTLILGPNMATDGITDFRFSRFVIIQDDHLCWPRQMRLSSLGCDMMDPLLPAGKRVEWLHRERLPWYGRAWSWLQEITVGYGYRPLRAGAWLAAFLASGPALAS